MVALMLAVFLAVSVVGVAVASGNGCVFGLHYWRRVPDDPGVVYCNLCAKHHQWPAERAKSRYSA